MSQKKSVSLRLSESDISKLKEISARLGVKEADLLRFTVKQTLEKLMPFRDTGAKGIDLIPTLIECGSELTYYLDLDSADLERIVNGDLDQTDRRVDPEDLDILATAGVPSPYFSYKLSELKQIKADTSKLINSLKAYLYDKYLGEKLMGYQDEPVEHSVCMGENQYVL